MGDRRAGLGLKKSSMSLSSFTSNSNLQVKDLPKITLELSSLDLIATLEAQQGNLSLQKHNIQRLISSLEKPKAKNPLCNSFKAIQEREKTLTSLRLELDELIRKEHELGLRQHRARKQRERDDSNTPSSVF
jgi:hypothetical protein